jgi:transposase-like protein
MSQDNVIELKRPESFIDDPITDILRNGARRLLEQALEIEIDSFLSQYAGLRDNSGRKRITRNGYLPERQIQTGIGQVPVKVPRVRDRKPDYESEGIRFN